MSGLWSQSSEVPARLLRPGRSDAEHRGLLRLPRRSLPLSVWPSDVLIGVGPFYWVWRSLGFEPDTSFLFWNLTVWSLNYIAAFVLLRRLSRGSGILITRT